jgi:predicted O-methyltransferase YrrM
MICYIGGVKNFIHRLFPALYNFAAKKKTFLRSIFIQNIMGKIGLNVSRSNDYHSPLPSRDHLQKNITRWNKPSRLVGVDYDLGRMKRDLKGLVAKYKKELDELPTYEEILSMHLGPGIPSIDGQLLYMMIRELRPKKYYEIGTGSSTYYAYLAGERNKGDGQPLEIVGIDPSPYEVLLKMSSIKIINKQVQDVDIRLFEKLGPRDVLFIDSTHVLKIDGDVSFLYLEVIPRLKQGVVIHAHDIPFPFNVPYPAKLHIMSKSWPVFWNEAMILQSFLAFNNDYQIKMSMPIIRHFDEKFLKKNFPNYKSVDQDPDTFSSLWFEKNSE